jgi:hypothetical protein
VCGVPEALQFGRKEIFPGGIELCHLPAVLLRKGGQSVKFIVFSLSDFHVHQRDAATRVRVRFVDAKNMDRAKEFMRSYYPGAWAIVPKKTFDKGIVHAEER